MTPSLRPPRSFNEELAWCIQAEAMRLSAIAATTSRERAERRVRPHCKMNPDWNSGQERAFRIMYLIHESVGSRENNRLAKALAGCRNLNDFSQAFCGAVESEVKAVERITPADRVTVMAHYSQAASTAQTGLLRRATSFPDHLSGNLIPDIIRIVSMYVLDPLDDFPEVARISTRVFQTLPLTPGAIVEQVKQNQTGDQAERIRNNVNGIFGAYAFAELFKTRGIRDELDTRHDRKKYNPAEYRVAAAFSATICADPKTWTYADVQIAFVKGNRPAIFDSLRLDS